MAPSIKLHSLQMTQLINRGDNLSFEKSVQTIEKFGRVSGLYLNSEKTSNMAWEQD